MTREHRAIRDSWATVIMRAIDLGDADAAYRLTIGLVRRLHELWEL